MVYRFTEVIRQDYQDCHFAAGFVQNHPIDTIYLELKRQNEEPTVILLRPDELASIAWVASGALWSHLLSTMQYVPDSSTTGAASSEANSLSTAIGPSDGVGA
jgi:hypothetical protein